jgi:serine/threonine protein kinase
MTIAAGTRLGPHEVLSLLGAGGMGEVHRARDPRLAREVAVKVLPEDFLEALSLEESLSPARQYAALGGKK